MKALIDGVLIELSQKDIDNFNSIKITKSITDKDRISALENAIADLAVMLMEVE